MTESKLAAIALIERIPDEQAVTVLKILQNVCELIGVDTKLNELLTERVEQNLALMEEVEALVGEDKPWRDEDEMIREPAETRSQRLKS